MVSHVDGGRLGLEGVIWCEIVSASTKSPLCGGSSGCRDEGTTKNKCVAHKVCIDQAKAQGEPCTSEATSSLLRRSTG